MIYKIFAMFTLVAAITLPSIVRVIYRHVIVTPVNVAEGIAVIKQKQSAADFIRDGTFKGKRALIIGGTRGIGRGIAAELASAGADVDIVGRTGGDEVVEAFRESGGEGSFTFHRADLSTSASCLKLVDGLAEGGKSFDLLVMTVGVWPGNEKTVGTISTTSHILSP
jgi:hypothetical protein